MQDIYANVDYALIDETRLQARIQEIADQITADYHDKEDLLLICVLKGGYMFLADLCRALKRPHTIDFMGISSYGSGTQSSGAVQIIMDLKQPINGRNILIVEDIIDSGHTLDYMRPKSSLAAHVQPAQQTVAPRNRCVGRVHWLRHSR